MDLDPSRQVDAAPGLGVQGVRVQGLGFRVEGSGINGLGFGVYG